MRRRILRAKSSCFDFVGKSVFNRCINDQLRLIRCDMCGAYNFAGVSNLIIPWLQDNCIVVFNFLPRFLLACVNLIRC